MSNHYHEQKKRISAATKNVILLFIFSVALTGAAVHFMKDGIPELKNKIEMLKSEKNKKEEELKTLETNLTEKEKNYNELKNKTDKK